MPKYGQHVRSLETTFDGNRHRRTVSIGSHFRTQQVVLNAGNAPRAGTTIDLNEWAHAALGIPEVRLVARAIGSDLKVWCWGSACPDAPRVMARFSQAIHQDYPLPANVPPIARVCLYGRVLDAPAAQAPPFETPDWTVRFTVRPAPPRSDEADSDAIAPQSKPENHRPENLTAEIDRALSDIATDAWIAVKKIEPLAGTDARRLWVACEAAYAPDPTLLARPIACRLRNSNLQGFRDAVLLGQVSGETRPEWMLRVDLTPPDRTVEAWARWGDVAAIAYRLNREIAPLGVQISAVQKEYTLHLVCSPIPDATVRGDRPFPTQAEAIAKLETVLERLAPRGLQGVTVYGVDTPYEASFPEPKAPCWVTWLDLPAKTRPDLVPTALELARGGSLTALTFVLERLLNPDLNEKLATGGVRVQIRRKEDLLHVMSEGLTCPSQDRVGPLVEKFLRQSQLSNLAGVRVYGRRSGQRNPRWKYGVDFSPRSPETTEVPEFSAVDADRPSEPTVSEPQKTPEPRPSVDRALTTLLCATPLFRPRQPLPEAAADPSRRPDTHAKAAAVWALLGLLLTVQADWITSEILEQRERAAMAPPSVETTDSPPREYAIEVPELPEAPVDRPGIFDASGFTAPTNAATVVKASASGDAAIVPVPEVEFPTFNSEQMDRQLALYKAYIEEFGVPDVLVVGSSRALRGIDPEVLQQALAEQGYPGVRTFNLSINGATAQVVNFAISEVLTSDLLPPLIIWADGARAFNSGREDVTYNAIVRSPGYRELTRGFRPIESTTETENALPDRPLFEIVGDRYQVLDDNLNDLFSQYSAAYPKRNTVKTYFRAAIDPEMPLPPYPEPTEVAPETADVPQDDPLLHFNGFVSFRQRFDPTGYYLQHPRVSGTYDADYAAFELRGIQLAAFRSLVDYVQSQKIELVFVNLPLTEDYLDPVRSQYEREFAQTMLELSQQYGFVFRNFSGLWPQKNEYFSDPSHLNRFGAAAVSHRLAQSPMVPWSGEDRD
ncbi:hypothetical protein AY599_04485 [Leptolyngbya valderiana BDU 20041]|nr:hypothetical protein AY599_04485 [Leptolyngbya valderiana BDU 20041]